MPKWKEGDRARVSARAVTEEDRKKSRYYEHMAGLVGTVENVYADGVALKVDRDALTGIVEDVHRGATLRMRERFQQGISEEQKKSLTKEEMEFDVHYVLLVQPDDLEKVK